MSGKWGNGELQAVLDIVKRYQVAVGIVIAATLFIAHALWKTKDDHDQQLETRRIVVAGFHREDSLTARQMYVVHYLFNQQTERLDRFQATLNRFDKHGLPVRPGRAPLYRQYGPPPPEVDDWFWHD